MIVEFKSSNIKQNGFFPYFDPRQMELCPSGCDFDIVLLQIEHHIYIEQNKLHWGRFQSRKHECKQAKKFVKIYLYRKSLFLLSRSIYWNIYAQLDELLSIINTGCLIKTV